MIYAAVLSLKIGLCSGLTIAKGYAANGAKVYITGRRIDVLDEAAKEVKEKLGLELVP